MIKREKYIGQIRNFYDSDLIKVIVGIRRCGKSVILQSIMEELKEKTDNIIYLNFEKTTDLMKVSNEIDLVKYIEKNKKNGKCYIFLDEIQELDNWQIAVKDLRLNFNNSIFITGSNSKLLSNELLTLLSGRFVSFRIRPFVYKEIIEYGNQINKKITIMDYLIWGGFPARFNINDIEATKIYLEDLENTIVFNDLIRRYKIKKTAVFKKIVSYILMNNSRIYSSRSIHRNIKAQCKDISLNTVIKYLEYLKQAYIIDEIPQYSKKTKKELAYYGKIYNADVCFNSLHVANNRFDIDHNLENIVYNELLYMGYSVKLYDNNGKEIDFIATKDNKTYLIQVAYSVVDEKAYSREFGAFSNLDNSNQKILITNDDVDFSTSTVRHIKLNDFLNLKELG